MGEMKNETRGKKSSTFDFLPPSGMFCSHQDAQKSEKKRKKHKHCKESLREKSPFSLLSGVSLSHFLSLTLCSVVYRSISGTFQVNASEEEY